MRGSQDFCPPLDPAENSGNSKSGEIPAPGRSLPAPPVVKLENPRRGVRSREAQRLKTERTVACLSSSGWRGGLLLIQPGEPRCLGALGRPPSPLNSEPPNGDPCDPEPAS